MRDGIRIGVIFVRSPDKEERRVRKQAARSLVDLLLAEGVAAAIRELPAAGETGVPGGLPEAELLLPAGPHSRQELRRLAAYAELSGIPSAGLDLAGAVLGADRVLLRRLLAGERIPQGLFRSFTRSQWEQDAAYFVMEMEMTLGYPCRIRPADACCPLHAVRAESREELQKAVEAVLRQTDRVLAEETVKGRVYAAVLGGGEEPGDIAVMELDPEPGVWDARGASCLAQVNAVAVKEKKKPKKKEEPLAAAEPPELPAAAAPRMPPGPGGRLEPEVRNMARRAFAVLQAKGPAILFFATHDGQSSLLLTDAELCPSLGPESLHAAAWRSSGAGDGARLKRMAEQALLRGGGPGSG